MNCRLIIELSLSRPSDGINLPMFLRLRKCKVNFWVPIVLVAFYALGSLHRNILQTVALAKARQFSATFSVVFELVSKGRRQQ